MKSIKERLEENYLLGTIRYKNEYDFFLMPIAWWIINYEKYDPSILSSHERTSNFRNGVLKVLDDNVSSYLNSINEDKISFQELNEAFKTISNEHRELSFFIDFDNKKYISGFYDIDIEDYLPDESWVYKSDESYKYLPHNLRKVWEK